MGFKMNRRTFLAASILIPGKWALAQDTRNLPMTAAVKTGIGSIRGLVRYGVNQFWGVPYGGSTAGPNRFMPPAKPVPWTGVKDCFQVKERAPQDDNGPISEVWSLDRREPRGEDCLSINIFTPGLGNGRRPVMVWLHGGGFSGGSGNWMLYDGTNLARQLKSHQTLDIPFAFYNIDLAPSMTGAGNERWALAHKISAAYAAFARTGNPNHPDLPNWPAFNLNQRPTMIFNNECKVLNDPNKEERLALKAVRERQASQNDD